MIDSDKIVSKVRLKDFNPTVGLNRNANKFTEVSWYLIKMFFFLTAFPFPSKLKVFFLKLYGAKVGYGVVIKPRVNIHMPWNLQIGNDVWIGEEVFILNFETITIGNNVCVSQRAFLCGGNHDFRHPAMPYRNGPIVLEDGSWVGACCFVGPGVTIGVDTVAAAGSIVTNNLNANSIYKSFETKFYKQRWF